MVAPRRFDHDQAAARVADGELVAAVAADYGVTPQAIYRLVTPGALEAEAAAQRRFRAGTCEVCGEYACNLKATGKRKNNPDGRVLCRVCRGKEMRERFRFDDSGRLLSVQCQAVDCANGERWQPPGNFAGHPRYRDIRPQGVHSICRACNTRMKRAWRTARQVPCTSCGAPTSPPGKEGRRTTDSQLCLTCARRTRAAA